MCNGSGSGACSGKGSGSGGVGGGSESEGGEASGSEEGGWVDGSEEVSEEEEEEEDGGFSMGRGSGGSFEFSTGRGNGGVSESPSISEMRGGNPSRFECSDGLLSSKSGNGKSMPVLCSSSSVGTEVVVVSGSCVDVVYDVDVDVDKERYARAERARKTRIDSACRFEYRRRLGMSENGRCARVGEAVVGRGVYGEEGENRFRKDIVPRCDGHSRAGREDEEESVVSVSRERLHFHSLTAARLCLSQRKTK